ncbi:hypothetical protein EVAR_3053_1 [Eumeta japonica]|uniref:Uncharacterized protein n=1 Tax=Eumeta variegata TaxID=151549 RepID=A0A4C1SW82_EUMVA|nr:hypothetical protein EVAR_3053_1 [Eumeta japonica]
MDGGDHLLSDGALAGLPLEYDIKSPAPTVAVRLRRSLSAPLYPLHVVPRRRNECSPFHVKIPVTKHTPQPRHGYVTLKDSYIGTAFVHTHTHTHIQYNKHERDLAQPLPKRNARALELACSPGIRCNEEVAHSRREHLSPIITSSSYTCTFPVVDTPAYRSRHSNHSAESTSQFTRVFIPQ